MSVCTSWLVVSGVYVQNDDMGIESEDDEIDEAEVVSETGFGSVIGELPIRCRTL